MGFKMAMGQKNNRPAIPGRTRPGPRGSPISFRVGFNPAAVPSRLRLILVVYRDGRLASFWRDIKGALIYGFQP
jgi:uncharacterized lipoprotein YbaY